MEQKKLIEDDEDFDWKWFHEFMKKQGQERRQLNLSDSLRLLAELGIDFTSNNGGVHSVIVDHGATWDFWPSTGKWAKRAKQPQYRRGVFNLVKDINNARPVAHRIQVPASQGARHPVGPESPAPGGEMAGRQEPHADPNP